MEHFVYEDRTSISDYLDLNVAKNARGLSLLGSMQDHVEKYFGHPKLQQIMQYTLVFLGGAPNNTPALYNLMSHVDFNMGVYYPENGLGGVVDGVVELGEELGVDFHTDAPAAEIKGREGAFVTRTEDGREFFSDYVVSDADYRHTEMELLDEGKRQYDADYWDSRTYAPSAFLLYLGVEGDVDPLAHHSLVLPTDWDDHFETIFDDPACPTTPRTTCVSPRRPTTKSHPRATPTSSRSSRSLPGLRTPRNSGRSTAIWCWTTSRRTPASTSATGSSSKSGSA
jgi:phytoene dehydrogenase-like protein